MADMDVSYTVVQGRYFAPDGEERPCWLATLADGTQLVWDVETGEQVLDFDGAYAVA